MACKRPKTKIGLLVEARVVGMVAGWRGPSKHLGAGDGHIDVAASVKTLNDGGFKGWIMIDSWQIPDPYDASTKGLKAIQEGAKA
jgi:sugar phosphate isomerase/epimerase